MTNGRRVGMWVAVALAIGAAGRAPARAETIRYAYVSLDQVPLPAPYAFFAPATVVNGRVYGTVFDEAFTVTNVAVYSDGAVTVGPEGSAFVANASGTIGGEGPTGQAALFRGDATIPVPALPGQSFANVVALGDNQLALVQSVDASSVSTFAYFRGGTVSAIDFGLPDPAVQAFMNDAGFIALTKQTTPTDRLLHGYRYDPRTQTSTPLPPFAGDPTDVNVLVQGIDAGGRVLGYSFTDFASPAYHERIGLWDHAGVFHPVILQTLNTSTLVFNDHDEIVMTNSEDGNSYLVPSPGTRLDLATLVGNLPAGLQLTLVEAIDNTGNITGYAVDQEGYNYFPFLLVRLGDHDRDPHDVSLRCPVPARIAQAARAAHRGKSASQDGTRP